MSPPCEGNPPRPRLLSGRGCAARGGGGDPQLPAGLPWLFYRGFFTVAPNPRAGVPRAAAWPGLPSRRPPFPLPVGRLRRARPEAGPPRPARLIQPPVPPPARPLSDPPAAASEPRGRSRDRGRLPAAGRWCRRPGERCWPPSWPPPGWPPRAGERGTAGRRRRRRRSGTGAGLRGCEGVCRPPVSEGLAPAVRYSPGRCLRRRRGSGFGGAPALWC